MGNWYGMQESFDKLLDELNALRAERDLLADENRELANELECTIMERDEALFRLEGLDR